MEFIMLTGQCSQLLIRTDNATWLKTLTFQIVK